MAHEITIIGGGAAGLLAAIAAARAGADVTILEKMDRPARKLAITGKGRCNITTGLTADEAIKEFGKNGKFLRGAFSRFYSAELLELLASIGIESTLERGQRVFPLSMRAPDVVDAITAHAVSLGVKILTNAKVTKILTADGKITGLETTSGTHSANKIILATGGASYPGTGSTGDGYALAAALGHTIVPPCPALVPITTEGKIPRSLSPLTLKNSRATLLAAGKKIAEEFGEITFAPYGLTGPAILPLGKTVAEHAGKVPLEIILNLKPALSHEILDKRLQRDFAALGNNGAAEILPKLLPAKAVPVFEDLWAPPMTRRACEVTKTERAALVQLLTSLTFTVTGTRPITEALVTSGGVSLRELNPSTMESKILPGLYICGELLDLDAGTGGFNLQCAFSTGCIAGVSAAKAIVS